MTTVGKPITCKAAIVWKFNENFSIETIEVQPPGTGEVRVKIIATGLCHSDLSQKSGYFPDHPVPYVAGHEGAGIVESVGKGVTTVKPGDKVFTLFLAHCRQCRVCKDNKCNICMDIGRTNSGLEMNLRTSGYDDTLRFSCNGKPINHTLGASAFSQYTVIPENSCVKVNPNTPLEKACIIACGVTTGYGSSANSVDIKPGDITAVWGMGGVGLATVLGCKDKGATTIIGIDANPDKEEIARKKGCTHFICLKSLSKPIEEVLIEMTGGGLDYGFACVGNITAMEDAVKSTRPGGTAVIVGVAPQQALMQIAPAYILASRKIKGAIAGDYKILDDVPKLVNRYLEGKLPIDDFITGYYKLEQLNEAVEVMKAGQSIRSVILMN